MKKPKDGGEVITPESLDDRIARARSESRTQQALELTKQLYKHEPTDAHRQLLCTVYEERARQLRGQGNLRDATTVLENALQLAGDVPTDWLARIGQELAECGDIRQAFRVAARIPASPEQARILAHAVDAAVSQGKRGQQHLPADLQTGYDLVIKAFEQSEAGQDDAARETLQGIGLQSPFLEWKVLLRGLLAYYQNDDAKALENWQRLSSDRLPARLLAPLRFGMDKEFRAHQSAETQLALRKQADQLRGSSAIQPLRSLQELLAREDRLTDAFRLAESVAAMLRQQAPQMLPRLAACFFWSMVHHGRPADVRRYQRLFGAPPDDPGLHRLRAMMFEHMHDATRAHESWHAYEQGVAANPDAWSSFGSEASAVAKRARALIWEHMGRLAASISDFDDEFDEEPDSPFADPDEPQRLSPGPEECFRKSIELAPEGVRTYHTWIEHCLNVEEYEQAAEVAKELLARFPDDLKGLECLAEAHEDGKRYDEAVACYRRALAANPLDRRLRMRLSTALVYHAGQLTERQRFEEAREAHQAALADAEGAERVPLLCKWAASEFKAGDIKRAEELVQEARTISESRLAVAFCMLIEVIRSGAPKVKTRFDKELAEAMTDPPNAAGALALAETLAAHHLAEVSYRGQQSHTKKVLAYLAKARKVEFSESQLTAVCASLAVLDATGLLQSFAAAGCKRFPKNAYFPMFEAESYFALGPRACPIGKMERCLEQARRLAPDLPNDEKKQALLNRLQEIDEAIHGGPLPGLLGLIFGGPDADDEDDEDFEDFEDFDDLPIGPARKKRKKSR